MRDDMRVSCHWMCGAGTFRGRSESEDIPMSDVRDDRHAHETRVQETANSAIRHPTRLSAPAAASATACDPRHPPVHMA